MVSALGRVDLPVMLVSIGALNDHINWYNNSTTCIYVVFFFKDVAMILVCRGKPWTM
jgi:hypothetical protein